MATNIDTNTSTKLASKKKSGVKVDDKALKFLIQKMAEGYSLKEACKKFPKDLPDYATIIRKKATSKDWQEDIARGYTMWLFQKMEELEELSSVTASEKFPNLPFREAEATLKRRMDGLKFMLMRMAPILSDQFKVATKVEVDNKGQPNIQILNYYNQPEAIQAGLTYENEV